MKAAHCFCSHLALLLGAALLLSAPSSATAQRPVYAPPAGQVLVGMYRPLNEPFDARTVQGEPGVVVAYTGLKGLPGITDAINVGQGVGHVDALMQQHPHSALALGVWAVDHIEGIASGEYDAQIDRLIALTERYRRPVYLRFGYEFDAPWNHYEPEVYVRAWKRFRARIDALRARHIVMVWQSAAFCGETYQSHLLERWYPGDDQVDWIAMSYFHPNGCGGLVAEGLVSFARQRGKPMMIAEATPKGHDLTGARYSPTGEKFMAAPAEALWAVWYQPMFDFIARNADTVRILLYINQNWDAYPVWRRPIRKDYWGDSRLQGSEAILNRWRAATAGPQWLWGGQKLLRSLGYPEPD